jgi:acyl CoA:acetate/3-ketoacid CoA transferase beta subunit
MMYGVMNSTVLGGAMMTAMMAAMTMMSGMMPSVVNRMMDRRHRKSGHGKKNDRSQ